MSWFSQSIQYNPNWIISLRSLWQTCYKIHKNIVPLPLWNIQWLHQSWRLLMLNLQLLEIQTWKHKVATSFFIDGHRNFFSKYWYIFVASGWILRLLLWPSSIIFFLSSRTSGTQTQSHNLIKPFSLVLKLKSVT